MMRVKVERVGTGLHPSEVVVAVTTKSGREELAVDGRSLHGSTLGIGWPVGQDEGYYLVELPNETFRGFWRVWVPKNDVTCSDVARTSA
jgi:hypothetical protein